MPSRGRRLLSSYIAPADALAAKAARGRHRLIAFGTSAAVGVIVYLAVIVPGWLHGATHFVAAYDAAVVTLLGFFWTKNFHTTGQQTKARAAIEDPGRNSVLAVVLLTVIVGLVSAVAIIGHGPSVTTALEKTAAYGFGIVAVAAGWFLMHTVYTFRYAHLFWYDLNDDGKPGGLKFPATEEPSDTDFAYLAFCIGTSFAVSDPQITSSVIRREIMFHSILSFAYNSLIIGLVINIFAGLFGGGGK